MKRLLPKRQGFVSQTFIVVLMIVITLTTQMLHYLDRANESYLMLEDYLALYKRQAKIVSYAKCEIANGKTLQDFHTDGCTVVVMALDGGYRLLFDDYALDIYVQGIEIVDWSLAAV